MIKMKKSMTIAAPAEKIFDVMDDSANLPKIWPNLSNVREVKRLPNGGTSFKFDYFMAGIRLEGFSYDVLYERPNRLVTRTTGGVSSKLDITFLPTADGSATETSMEIEYEVPFPLVGILAEMIVAKINESDIIYVLNYLKEEVE